MKPIPRQHTFLAPILALTMSLAMCPVLRVQADEVQTTRTTTTTTTTAGTISEFGPDRLIVRAEAAAEPITYAYTKRTTYVDEAGAPVSVETIRSGVPVTVHYTREGDRLIADRVVVRRSPTRDGPSLESTRGVVPVETRPTRTTTEEIGTVGEFGPNAFTVRVEEGRDPVRYTYTKTTTYVDETGAPVSVETVRSGVPVTVHYSNEGESRVVTRVIVHKDKPGLFERLKQKRNEERVREDAERLKKSEEKLRREKRD
jgi:hypothetical protein